MSSPFRTAAARVFLAISCVSLIACSDSVAAPASHRPIAGLRALLDSSKDIDWDDTTDCRNGYIILGGRVECGPE